MGVSSAGVDPQCQNDVARQISLLKQGEHLCSVYTETEEMLAQVVPYVRTGLLNGERCVYVADENGQESIVTALMQGGVDAELEMGRNRLVFWSRDDYRQPGEFDPNKMLNFVSRNLDRALADGHNGLRFAVEMSWTMNNGVNDDELVAWEDLINKISFPGRKVSFLCQYNSRLLSSDLVKKAVYVHPVVALGKVVCPNLYYRPAADVLTAQDHGDLAWLLAKLRSQSVGSGQASAEVPTLKQVYDVITTALTQLPVGLYMCESPSGFLRYYNPRAAEIWGWTPNCGDSNERCCTAVTLLTPDGTELPHDQCPMAQAIRHGVIVSDRELMIERSDRSQRTVLVSSTPIRNSHGQVVGALALMQDMTERKRAETAMAGLIRNLEQSRAELQDKIEDLEKFEDVVVGRVKQGEVLVQPDVIVNVTAGSSFSVPLRLDLPLPPKEDRLSMTPMKAGGTIQVLLHGNKGEVHGMVLSDGTQVRLPPDVSDEFRRSLRVGEKVNVDGYGTENAFGRAIEALSMSADKKSLTPLDLTIRRLP